MFIGNALPAKNVGEEFFFNLSHYLDVQKKRDSQINYSVIKYYQILLKMNEVERGFSIFDLDKFHSEKQNIISCFLDEYCSENIPSKKQLEKIFEELTKLDWPPGLFDEYISLSSRAHEIGCVELAKKSLEKAADYVILDGFDNLCHSPARKKVQLYAMCRIVGLNEDATRYLKEMESFSISCPSKLTMLSHYERDVERTRVLFSYAEALINLRESNRARKYLDQVVGIIGHYPENASVKIKFFLSDYFSLLEETEKSKRILVSLFDELLPTNHSQMSSGDIPKIKDDLYDFLRYIKDLSPDAVFFKISSPAYFEKKHLAIPTFLDYSLDKLSTDLLFRIYTQSHNYEAALDAVEAFGKRWKKKASIDFENFYVRTIMARQKNDANFKYKKFNKKFDDSYNNRLLDYNYASLLIEKERAKEAQRYLSRALNLLYNRNCQDFEGIEYDSIGELYWRLNDEEGLRKTLKLMRNKKKDLNYSTAEMDRELLKWSIDVLLSKDKYSIARKIIEKNTDSNLRCIGLLYSAKHFLDKGEPKKSDAMLDLALLYFKEKKITAYSKIYEEFYRIFILRPNQKSPNERRRQIHIFNR